MKLNFSRNQKSGGERRRRN